MSLRRLRARFNISILVTILLFALGTTSAAIAPGLVTPAAATPPAAGTDLGVTAAWNLIIDPILRDVFVATHQGFIRLDYSGAITGRWVGPQADALLVSPDGGTLYVTAGGYLTEFDPTSLTVRSRFALPDPCTGVRGLAYVQGRIWLSGSCRWDYAYRLYSFNPANPSAGFLYTGVSLNTQFSIATGAPTGNLLVALDSSSGQRLAVIKLARYQVISVTYGFGGARPSDSTDVTADDSIFAAGVENGTDLRALPSLTLIGHYPTPTGYDPSGLITADGRYVVESSPGPRSQGEIPFDNLLYYATSTPSAPFATLSLATGSLGMAGPVATPDDALVFTTETQINQTGSIELFFDVYPGPAALAQAGAIGPGGAIHHHAPKHHAPR